MELFNTLYSKQYYLHDTSSGSIGINMESAWEIASGLGQDITVAVVDAGVDHNHEDLPNVLDGYTVGDLSGKGDPVSTIPDVNSHGVACAGIIGATNNSIGIRGIVSDAKILPVNIFISANYDDEDAAKAIIWASKRSDVISCSWGDWRGYYSRTIAEAINEAMTEGRNGKGCVIVFASGNYAQYANNLAFPASVEGVISVGAIQKNGVIWDYSQRGTGLSLVAPSGNVNASGDIVTTDRMGSLGYNTKGNYTESFGGTSAACPQVAGVAALILSHRPDLTAAEVKDVLERTATDLGPAGYDTTYGHGMVNAYEAVKEVILSIDGQDIAKSDCNFSIGNFPENATVTWSVQDEDKDKINLTVSGEGNKFCKAELSGTKTVRTTLTAIVKLADMSVITLTKRIVILGTFSGTYSIPAKNINGVSIPAIVNRPFTAGASIPAYAGAWVTINSEDLNYYSSSWSGTPIGNWTVGLDYLRFSCSNTATSSSNTILEFKGKVGGTARVYVRTINPPTPPSIHATHDGGMLNIVITKEEPTDSSEYESELELATKKSSNTETLYDVWTIEVVNVSTGARQDSATTALGECQFNTSGWPAGIYLIVATDGNETISKKITIK